MKKRNVFFVFGMMLLFISGCTRTGDATNIQHLTSLPTLLSRDLSLDELAEFSERLELPGEDNAFLTCEYSEPQDVDLNEILYSSPHIAKRIGEKEKQKLIKNKYIDEQDFALDGSKYELVDIENFCREKLGIEFSQIKKNLNYLYVKEYNSYYLFRGDTNVVSVKCLEGKLNQNGLYEIHYKTFEGWPFTEGIVTIRKADGRFEYFSNIPFKN